MTKPELLPCPFCGEHLLDQTQVKFPKPGLARMHPGALDDGSCPIAGWGFYDEQLAAWNQRAAPAPSGDYAELVERLLNTGLQSPAEAAAAIQTLTAEVARLREVGAGAWVPAEQFIAQRNALEKAARFIGEQVHTKAGEKAYNEARAALEPRHD